MSDAPTWVNAPVVDEKLLLNEGQVAALLLQMQCLRHNTNLAQVLAIKEFIEGGENEQARAWWSDFSEEEQHALWVAPTYGGIFTTHERKVLQNGV